MVRTTVRLGSLAKITQLSMAELGFEPTQAGSSLSFMPSCLWKPRAQALFPRSRSRGLGGPTIHPTQPGDPGNLLASPRRIQLVVPARKGPSGIDNARGFSAAAVVPVRAGPRSACHAGLWQLDQNELTSAGPWNQPSVPCPSVHLTLIYLSVGKSIDYNKEK